MAKRTLHFATLLLLVCGLSSCAELVQAIAETSTIASNAVLQSLAAQQGAASTQGQGQAAAGYSPAQYAAAISSNMNLYNTSVDPNKNPYAISLPSTPTVSTDGSSSSYNGGTYSTPASNSSGSSSSSSGPANYTRHEKNCDRCHGTGTCQQCQGTGWYSPSLSGTKSKCGCDNGKCRVCHGTGKTYAGYW